MSGVRVLVGKGAFVLTSDSKRARCDISGPQFAGWENPIISGFSRRPESAVCIAVQSLVRAADPTLRRWRQDLGASW